MQTILEGFAFLPGEILAKPVPECSGIWRNGETKYTNYIHVIFMILNYFLFANNVKNLINLYVRS
jgi:hypothetical protein